jgi:hypothetical protein
MGYDSAPRAVSGWEAGSTAGGWSGIVGAGWSLVSPVSLAVRVRPRGGRGGGTATSDDTIITVMVSASRTPIRGNRPGNMGTWTT